MMNTQTNQGENKMTTQSKHYEIIADKLRLGSDDQLKAYRTAQNHLQAHDRNYMVDLKRLQNKIIKNIEKGDTNND